MEKDEGRKGEAAHLDADIVVAAFKPERRRMGRVVIVPARIHVGDDLFHPLPVGRCQARHALQVGITELD